MKVMINDEKCIFDGASVVNSAQSLQVQKTCAEI